MSLLGILTICKVGRDSQREKSNQERRLVAVSQDSHLWNLGLLVSGQFLRLPLAGYLVVFSDVMNV